MDGVYVVSEALASTGGLSLIFRRENMEVMRQTVLRGATVWISPSNDPGATEFFYLLSGELTLMLTSGEPTCLKAGGAFYTAALKSDLRITANVDTELLYVANRPMFDELYGFQGNLETLLEQINAKDHITLAHSRNVLRYASALYERLNLQTMGLAMDELFTAALFHDVGKCFMPDNILKKAGHLTSDEYAVAQKHPIDSASILRPRFGDRVAQIARWHHERLDGSGYPDGIAGDQLPIGARLISVIDAFDAMTARRPYSPGRPREDALRELRELPNRFDPHIVAELVALDEAGGLPDSM